MNVLLVDDEPLALDVLETFVSRLPDLNLIARCANALEADQALRDHDIDLMFLDIQMPQLTGIDFLKSLRNPPMVIFTTAYREYALQGFELDALDYLLKPIGFDRFIKAINKARDMYKQRKGEVMEKTDIEAADDHVYVKADKKLMRIEYDDIIYIEGLKDYVIIRCAETRTIALQTMKSLEEKLPAGRFRRIHRSFIVSMDKIISIEANGVEVREKDKIRLLPVGKNYRDELLEEIEKRRL